MNPGAEDDPYVYPGTKVLRNKPDIRDPEQFKAVETDAVAYRIAELDKNPLHGKFDLAHLRAIHHALFQDIYDWAGELRTVNISKGSTTFAPIETRGHSLESWGNAVFRALARENHLRGSDQEHFAGRLAHHFNEINYLHPFREGNGRATRVFMTQLADNAGFSLDLRGVGHRQWINASIAADNGDLRQVHEILRSSLMPARAAAFERQPEADALRKHPELKGAYEGLRRLEKALRERFPNDDESREKYVQAARDNIKQRLRAGEVLQAREVSTRSKDRDQER